MWHDLGICVVALVVIAISHWTYRWRNPPCNGTLPPGSMGFPLLGETLQFLFPCNSLDIPPFVKTRIQKYGSVFKTSLVGQPIVVSSDPKFNHLILQQECKSVEVWYMDSFAKLLEHSGSSSTKDVSMNVTGHVHKYLRNLILNHFGLERVKEKLLPQLEKMANEALCAWATQDSVEVKNSCSTMIFDYTSKMLFSDDIEKSEENMREMFTNFLEGFMCLPLNIPGTAFHRCLQNKKKTLKMLKDIIHKRQASSEKIGTGDFLDHVIGSMKSKTFLTEDFISFAMFGLQFASFEIISSTLTLAMKFLSEHPQVIQELVKENEEILRKRENVETGMTWKEYKSMTFTMQVINETLRLSSFTPGIPRRAIKDIHVNGYTIPKGWTILVLLSAVHLNSATYEDPLAFNPWRWKDLEENVTSKNFIPFGGGTRLCPGAEFSKVLMAVFLHVLVTKFRWTTVMGGEIVRSPILRFKNGYYIRLSERLK